MARVTREWVHSDFFAVCRVADDMHRAAQDGSNRHAADAATGAMVALLERYATPCDCRDLATGFGCGSDVRSLAYALRDEANDRHQPPSTVLVDVLHLQVF